MRNNYYTNIVAIALVAFALCACQKEQTRVQKKEVNTVFVQRPQKRTIEIWDNYTARLEGEKSVEIRARVSGYLEKIFFKDGDFVKEGDILFKIDPSPFEAIVDACKASVAEINAKIELAVNNLNRAKQLYKENAISKEVLETRNSELLSAKAVLMSAQAKLKEAKLNLEFTTIRAPMSGYIGKRRVDVGNLVTSAQTLMTTLVSRDTLYAYFEISERDVIKYGKINLFASIDATKKKGPPVRLKLMDEENFSHHGVLTYVDNKLNASSIELRADIDNSKKKLFPGMFAKIELRAGEPVEKFVLPESAIGTDLIGRFVYVVNENNMVEYRPVKVAECIEKMQIIEEGLDGSERVIINGIQRARPGKTVTPVESIKKVSTKNAPVKKDNPPAKDAKPSAKK